MEGQSVIEIARGIQGRLLDKRGVVGIRNSELGDYLAPYWEIASSTGKTWITCLERGSIIVRLSNETDPSPVRRNAGSVSYIATQHKILDYLAALGVSEDEEVGEILDGILLVSPSFDFGYKSRVQPYQKRNS